MKGTFRSYNTVLSNILYKISVSTLVTKLFLFPSDLGCYSSGTTTTTTTSGNRNVGNGGGNSNNSSNNSRLLAGIYYP